MPDLDNLLTVNEAAAKMRVKPHTVRVWMTQGRLERTKVGGRTLIERSELERFVACSNPELKDQNNLPSAA